jgi:hypothetical protein
MLDLSLGNWHIWYEKFWAAIYLVPNDTKVLKIYFLKNTKILHDEFLYDKAWIPIRTIHVIDCIEFCQALLMPYERFVMLLNQDHVHTTHICTAPTLEVDAETYLSSRFTQKCSTPTPEVNTKTC